MRKVGSSQRPVDSGHTKEGLPGCDGGSGKGSPRDEKSPRSECSSPKLIGALLSVMGLMVLS